MSEETPDEPTQSDTPRARELSDREQLFLEMYGTVGTVKEAARLSGIHRSTHYEWLKDETYAEAFKVSEQEFSDLVRETVRLRAVIGVQQEVYSGGRLVGFRTEVSDRLLELLAKAKCPEFRDKHEISGPNGGPIHHISKVIVEFIDPPAADPPQS